MSTRIDKRTISRYGPDASHWKGGRSTRGEYATAYAPDHPRAHKRHVYEHILIAEKVIGKLLPEGAEIHHVNEDKQDNRHCNLVICESFAYHMLLHHRKRIIKAGGNPNTDAVCSACRMAKPLGNFHLRRAAKNGRSNRCRPCALAEVKRYRKRIKETTR